MNENEQWRLVCEVEAARILNLARRTLQGMRLRGDGPPFVQITERRIGYAISDLKDWALARASRSTSESTARAAPRERLSDVRRLEVAR